MASSSSRLSPPLPLAVAAFILIACANPAGGCFPAIFSFGDSLTDTGNLLISTVDKASEPISRLPYGETYFHRPTGRSSDGRLVLDFIAQAMGLPLVRPYLAGGGGEHFRHGANFAVSGATALGNDFFRAMGLNVFWTNYSLGTQIEWFKQLLPSLSSSSGCDDILKDSLFIMGEIGGNDYIQPLLQGRGMEEIRPYVPKVIDAISSAIKQLIALGAKTLLVPGNFPIGCVSATLTMEKSQRVEDYDPRTGCLTWLNQFIEYHEGLLQKELDHLRRLHPRTTIIYADYYGAAMSIYRSPQKFGFVETLAACCGGNGPYNWSASVSCAGPMAHVCSDPSSYVCWDGVHLTEATYRNVARGILEGKYSVPPFNHICRLMEIGNESF